MTAGAYLAAAALVVGSLLNLIAAVGLHRFPDVFARMHAQTKLTTLGLALILGAAAAQAATPGAAAKLLLVVVLQFLTAPVAAHMIGRGAHLAGTEIAAETLVDELAADEAMGGHGDGRRTAGS